MHLYMSLILVMCSALQLTALQYKWIQMTVKDGLTSKEKQFLVDVHNFYRRAVTRRGTIGNGPSAANMRELIWNEELAKDAQRWSSKCNGIVYHDQPHERGYSGQNTQYDTGRESIFSRLMIGWADEEADYYNYGDKNYFNRNVGGKMEKIGHYTQIMWARSSQIGCGFSKCAGSVYASLMCNYMPRGNIQGIEIYKRGPPCSQCDPGYGFCNDNLCAKSCNRRDCRCTVDERLCKHNGGMYDSRNCFCHCSRGKMGLHCEKDCTDKFEGDQMVPCSRDHCRPRTEKYFLHEMHCPWTCGSCERTCTNTMDKYCRGSDTENCKKHKASMLLVCYKRCTNCENCTVDVARCSYNGGSFDRTHCVCQCPEGKNGKLCEKNNPKNQGRTISGRTNCTVDVARCSYNGGSFDRTHCVCQCPEGKNGSLCEKNNPKNQGRTICSSDIKELLIFVTTAVVLKLYLIYF